MSLFGVILVIEVLRALDYEEMRTRTDALRAEHGARKLEHMSRVRWQEWHRAERSFPCGAVLVRESRGALPRPAPRSVAVPPPPSGPPVTGEQPTPPTPVPPARVEAPGLMRPAQVTAAVLQDDLVFLAEDGLGEVEEAGRLPRTAITGIDVVDAYGAYVPEPVRETIEPLQLVFAVLKWSNEGAPDEERFAFQSPWLAWGAARRLEASKRG